MSLSAGGVATRLHRERGAAPISTLTGACSLVSLHLTRWDSASTRARHTGGRTARLLGAPLTGAGLDG